MKCIPKDLFVPQDYLETLICPLGKGVFRNPVVLPCQHAFCKECIEEYLKTNNDCPSCHEKTAANRIMAQGEIAILVNMAPVKCNRCKMDFSYEEYCKHENSCKPREVLWSAPKLIEPETSGKVRRITCNKCKHEVPYTELILHEEFCPEKMIECPQRCGKTFKQSEKECHIKLCPNPKSSCQLGFAGCYFDEHKHGQDSSIQGHNSNNVQQHLEILCGLVSKMKTKLDIFENAGTIESQQYMTTKEPQKIDITWSTGSKLVFGSKKSAWSFYLSNKAISKNFLANIKIVKIGEDANTWKICLGLFNSPKFVVGSWEKYKNGYGYILGNGNKVHDKSAQPYGENFAVGDIISIEHKNGSITFYKNKVSQNVAFTGISGPFYLAASISDVSHTIQIEEVIEID